MILQTKHFGEIEVDQNGIITFEEGLPGFESAKKFVFLYKSEDTPFIWFQSTDKPELTFVVVNPLSIIKDYDIFIKEEILKKLDIQKMDDVLIYSIVVIPDDVSKMSMNLKAPIIINTKNNKGLQHILDTDTYSVRHYILDELRRQEVAGDAGSDKKKGTIDNTK